MALERALPPETFRPTVIKVLDRSGLKLQLADKNLAAQRERLAAQALFGPQTLSEIDQHSIDMHALDSFKGIEIKGEPLAGGYYFQELHLPSTIFWISDDLSPTERTAMLMFVQERALQDQHPEESSIRLAGITVATQPVGGKSEGDVYQVDVTVGEDVIQIARKYRDRAMNVPNARAVATWWRAVKAIRDQYMPTSVLDVVRIEAVAFSPLNDPQNFQLVPDTIYTEFIPGAIPLDEFLAGSTSGETKRAIAKAFKTEHAKLMRFLQTHAPDDGRSQVSIIGAERENRGNYVVAPVPGATEITPTSFRIIAIDVV